MPVIPQVNNPQSRRNPASSTSIGNGHQNNKPNEQNLNHLKRAHQFLTKNKREINTYANLIGAATNLLTFIEGNFSFLNIDMEKMETVSNLFAKVATSVRGFIGAIDSFNKTNLFPLLGFAGEVPAAIFSSGYNLWLTRGVPQGISQFLGMIKRRGAKFKTNKQEITLPRKDGDNFKKYGIGFIDGFLLTLKESGKIIKELFTSPMKGDQKMPHSVFVCSIMQIVGPLIYLTGFKKLGAAIRDFFGMAVDVGYIIDKKQDDEPSYVPAGTAWVGSGIVDLLKRFDTFENTVKNSTQLSLFFDGIAGVFYGSANFGTEEP